MCSKRTSLTWISSTLPLELHKSFNLSGCINILKSQQISEMAEFGLSKQFGEYVHQVFISQYIFNCNIPIFNCFSDEVILDINVLGPSMESVVLWYVMGLPPGYRNWLWLAYLTHISPEQTHANTSPPSLHESTQHTLPLYSITQWCTVS